MAISTAFIISLEIRCFSENFVAINCKSMQYTHMLQFACKTNKQRLPVYFVEI